MEDVLVEQKNFFDFINNEKNKNRISHAYLIETCDYDKIDDLITEFLKILLCSGDEKKDLKLSHLIDSKLYPDIKYIKADGASIKKEQLIALMDEFKNKSMYDNKQVYIIEDATKLNMSSANTMLKFLEEPEENIIAILIANNKYKVIDTILSRCQVISLNASEKNNFSDETESLAKMICSNSNFLFFDNILEIIPDRVTALDKLKELENYLFYERNNSLFGLTLEKNISIISILEEILEKLNYNVNYKLIIDDLLISILEVVK